MSVKNGKSYKKGKSKEEAPKNVVFVGAKPVMNYVMAVVTQLSSSGEVTLKARPSDKQGSRCRRDSQETVPSGR